MEAKKTENSEIYFKIKLPAITYFKSKRTDPYDKFFKFIEKKVQKKFGVKKPAGMSINVQSVFVSKRTDDMLRRNILYWAKAQNKLWSKKMLEGAAAMHFLCYSPCCSKDAKYGYAYVSIPDFYVQNF